MYALYLVVYEFKHVVFSTFQIMAFPGQPLGHPLATSWPPLPGHPLTTLINLVRLL